MRKLVICGIILKFILQSSSLPCKSPNLEITRPKRQAEVFDYHVKIDTKTFHKAHGYIRDVKGENIVAQKGIYEIYFPGDNVLKINYVADENGYVVKHRQHLRPIASTNLASEVAELTPISSLSISTQPPGSQLTSTSSAVPIISSVALSSSTIASANQASDVVEPRPVPLLLSISTQPESQSQLTLTSPTLPSISPLASSQPTSLSATTSLPPLSPTDIDTREPVIDPKAIGSLVG